jgi:hypothetical protein
MHMLSNSVVHVHDVFDNWFYSMQPRTCRSELLSTLCIRVVWEGMSTAMPLYLPKLQYYRRKLRRFVSVMNMEWIHVRYELETMLKYYVIMCLIFALQYASQGMWVRIVLYPVNQGITDGNVKINVPLPAHPAVVSTDVVPKVC